MTETELCYLTASELQALYRSRQVSPVEVMQAVIDRAAEVEPQVNALSQRFFDQALDKARKAEQRFSAGKPKPRALEGIPLVIKDDASIKGQLVTEGSLVYKDRVAERTDPHVARLLAAGAIVHARTTCSEFCAAWITDTRLNGTTRCPWNLDYTPGGSSGGSAAALASGSTIIATGSDNAGSIRQPASTCGVVGYKPPHGRIPESPPHNLDITSVVGPLTRSVSDCALMQNVMSGPHPDDIDSTRQRVRLPTTFKSIDGARIAVSADLGFFAVDAEVRRNLDRVADALRGAGAVVNFVDVGWDQSVHDIGVEHWGHHSSRTTVDRYRQHRALLSDYSVYYAEAAASWQPNPISEIIELRTEMYRTLGPILHTYDALICPTTAVPSIPASMGPDQILEVDGRTIDADFEWCLTYPFNLLGQLPALSVPSGLASTNVPTGLQVVARPYDDARVFRVAAAIESMVPWAYDGVRCCV